MTTGLDSSPRRSLPRWARWGIEIALVLALIVGIRLWQAPEVASGPAPALSGVLADGAPVRLDEYRGAPVLVAFWASWCPMCRLELSTLESVAEDWQVVSVAMQSGSSAEVAAFLRKEGIDALPYVNDPDGVLAREWGVKGVPVAFVLDAEGRVCFAETGLTSGWGLRARLWWAGRGGSGSGR
jgi:thiol-disulfide isomerase/thioredoxin